MAPAAQAAADLWATGISADGHPTTFRRDALARRGVVVATDLLTHPVPDPEHPPRVRVAGVVTHRQRPATAGGTIFVNLEDETGLVNVVVSRGCWIRFRRVATAAPALLVTGRLERAEGVVNVLAEHIVALDMDVPARSRDFR
ncbi:MAG TPA: OB-fold nucleic acid binding domain-containing protein [Acidimicrobiales bacterium]|nr:OB-fold nucleic acid binding domain-containing protein [Acidimicrobiales bacterium]